MSLNRTARQALLTLVAATLALTTAAPAAGLSLRPRDPPDRRPAPTSDDSRTVGSRTTAPQTASDEGSVAPRQGGWAWPLAPTPVVVERFDPPEHPWSSGHRGVDLTAAVGQPVLSPTAGTITFSGVIAGRGVVVVAHPDGVRSTFEPVEDGLRVGAAVARGQPVARLSGVAGHCAPASCLHWGVLRDETYLDPLGLLGLLRVILLPLG